ncbi:hypothetical protein [Streptomyces ziwulingensis]|uniref:Uncharacterized protein n=1 Tax=Streptomyces ziwulingensis TaxID=1045501 RepID=A0ABP9CPX0_9ACTN
MSEPASSVQELPAEVLEILALPPRDAVNADQARGATCVWGPEALTIETAVDLGEQQDPMGGHWFPRACGPHVGERAHHGLLAHSSLCEQCGEDRSLCPTGHTLYRLVREHRR